MENTWNIIKLFMHTATVHTQMYTCAKFEISNTTKSTKNIYDHSNITGHSTTLYNFSIVGREEQNLSRLIKGINVHKDQSVVK